jgi:hypothetical protein
MIVNMLGHVTWHTSGLCPKQTQPKSPDLHHRYQSCGSKINPVYVEQGTPTQLKQIATTLNA